MAIRSPIPMSLTKPIPITITPISSAAGFAFPISHLKVASATTNTVPLYGRYIWRNASDTILSGSFMGIPPMGVIARWGTSTMFLPTTAPPSPRRSRPSRYGIISHAIALIRQPICPATSTHIVFRRSLFIQTMSTPVIQSTPISIRSPCLSISRQDILSSNLQVLCQNSQSKLMEQTSHL